MTRLFLLVLFCLYLTGSYAQEAEIRPRIIHLADKLKKDNTVHFGFPVGFAGKPESKNKYYKSYLKLEEKATNKELILLTRESTECLVVYSFAILQSRNYGNLKDIFLEHISDTTFFWTAGGCTGILNRVNWFMLRRLKPKTDLPYNNYFTKEEFDKYCLKFRKEDNLFSCN